MTALSLPLLLLSGNMCGEDLWSPLMAALPGKAFSIPRLDANTITGMAVQALSDAPDRFVPIGYSMGAIVALEIARTAPERLAGLGLLDCNPGADLPERAAARPGQQAIVRAGGLEGFVADTLVPLYLAAARAQDAAIKHRIVAMALELGPDVFVAQSEALRTRADLRSVLPRIDIPVFLACGAEDRLCPPEWHEATRAACHDAELHVIREAGHMLPLERPEALAACLSPWLATLEP